jgi:hypothetical protein
VNEGSSYTLKIGNVIDPGPDTITGYTINWGDGNIDFFGSMASAPAASPANTQHTHTYADGPNLRTVNITVEDQDGFHTLTDPNGPSTSGSLDVTVVNVAPTATLQNFGDVNEGSANTVRFINQFDPSNSGPTNDTSSGFHYAYDFNNDGVYDLGGATPSYSSGITNAQVVVPSSFLLTPGSHTVRARIIDKDEGFTEYTTTFTVNNVAPVVSIPSTFNAGTGVPFDIGGSFTDAGNDTPWTGQVDYGDGAGFQSLTVNSANKTFTLSHTYATSGPKTITVKITDSFGAIGTATTNVAVTDTTLQVVNFVQNISGFDVQFNRAVQIGDVALYGIGHSFASPFTVLDHNNVPVNGSLIWDAVTNTAHWVKTGGVLSTDTYNVTLVSGATGNTFHGAGLSDALDGDANDTAGGNFVRSVSVTAPTTRVLSIPDFARGQGQSVKVNQHGVQPLGAPNVVDPNGGLPVYIDNGSGVKSVDFVLNYNPSLLTISTAATDLQVPANWVVQISDDLQGHLHVLVFSFDGSDLGAGQHTVITFKNVSVPAAAPYGAAELLTMSNLLLNENEVSPIPAVADAAVHKAADLGDTTGNGTVGGAADASFVAQVVVGNNTGFAAYPLTDPLIIGDVSGDGTLSGLDGSFIAQIFTNPGSQAQVPVEGGLNTPIAGVDPIIRTGLGQTTSIIGTRGQHLNATVDITDTGSGLFAADLIITYDTTRLDLSNAGVSLSAQLASAGWFLAKNVDDGAGTIRISTFSQDLPLGAGPVSLLNLDFTVPSTAPEGVSPLAILNPNGTQTNNSSRLNEGALVISTDLGTITIPPMKGDWNHDGQRTIDDIPAMLTALTDLNGYKVNRGLSDSDVLAIGDINNDGFITNRDIQAMLDLVAADQILGSGGGSSSEESAVPPPVSPSVVQTQNSMATDAGTLGQAQSSAFALSPETGVQVSIAAGSPQPLPVATLNSPSSDAADSSPASSALVDASNYKVGNTASIPAALFASSLTTFNVGGTAFDSGTSPAGMYGHGEASVPTLDSTAATDDFYAKLHEGKVASWEHCLLGEHPGSSDTSIDVAWEELLTDLADSRATVM